MKSSNIKIILVVIILGAIGLLAVSNFKQVSQDTTRDTTKDTQNSSATGELSTVGVGAIASNFSFQTVERQEVTLSSLKGQPVLFAFALTTGCAACIIEAGNVREAQKQIPFKVIQLSISPYDTPENLLSFRKAYGNSDWLMGFDKDERIAKQYQVRAVDTTILVDAQGKIIYRDDGIPAETEDIVNVLKKSQR